MSEPKQSLYIGFEFKSLSQKRFFFHPVCTRTTTKIAIFTCGWWNRASEKIAIFAYGLHRPHVKIKIKKLKKEKSKPSSSGSTDPAIASPAAADPAAVDPGGRLLIVGGGGNGDDTFFYQPITMLTSTKRVNFIYFINIVYNSSYLYLGKKVVARNYIFLNFSKF